MRAKNGFWDKKKEKACEGRRVCERNERDIWGGKGGIEEVIEGNNER